MKEPKRTETRMSDGTIEISYEYRSERLDFWHQQALNAEEEIVALNVEVAKLRAALKAIEWCSGGGLCHVCEQWKEAGHFPGCLVAEALK